MTMALGKRKRSRQRRYKRPIARGWRKPERKTGQSHVDKQRPLGAGTPNGQVQHPFLRKGHNEQNPQSARRNNFPGEQISRRFLLLSENLSASNYPGAAND